MTIQKATIELRKSTARFGTYADNAVSYAESICKPFSNAHTRTEIGSLAPIEQDFSTYTR